VPTDGKATWTEPSVQLQLDEFVNLAWQVVALIDELSQSTVAALDAAGWSSSQTFALRAELAGAAEYAGKSGTPCTAVAAVP
jgi:hypothetical protein